MQVATITGNVLDGMGDNLNKQITSQSLSTLEKQDVKVSASDIKGITNPVKVDNQEIHKVKDHQGGGNAPFLMFMPVWMGYLWHQYYYSLLSEQVITLKFNIELLRHLDKCY